MNEVVIDRGPSPYLCNLDLYIEHKYITSVQGDGKSDKEISYNLLSTTFSLSRAVQNTQPIVSE